MRYLSFVLALCLIPLMGTAQTYPESTSPFVNDFAGLLDKDDAAEVRGMLSALKTSTGIEMTVVTLERQSEYAPNLSLESFATNLFNEWGIGDAARNNGILVLVIPSDRAMRIELGLGYPKRWDNVAGRVIDRSFLPSFRSDRYAKGIKDGVADAIATLARPFAEGKSAPKERKGNGQWGIAIFAIIASIIMFGRRLIDSSAALRRCPNCGNRGGLHISREVKYPASRIANGSGLKATRCDKCSYADSETYILSRLSPNRNFSGSGGFGGGRSGGGGASGRW